MREVTVNVRPRYAEELPNFGHGLVLLQVERFGRLGFGEGFLGEAFGPAALPAPGTGSCYPALGAGITHQNPG